MRSEHRLLIAAAVSGLLFGLGLSIAGMTDPMKVLGFLDIFGDWDASLALVMGAGLMMSGLGVWWVKRRGNAVCADLQLPTATQVDRSLLLGSALFGIGWGVAGYCPGPALAGLAQGNAEAWIFVPVMAIGFWIGDRIAGRLSATH